MSCEKYKDLINKRLDGMLSDKQFAELKTHTEECQICRAELDRCAQIQDIIKQAFSSQTSAKQASRTILSQIAPRRIKPASTPSFRRQTAIAASVLLAIGLLLGFGLAKVTALRRIAALAATKTPIRVTDLEGTVLVRHQGSDIWQILQANSNIHVGDTFHSAAKSNFTLEMKGKSTLEVDQNSMLVLELSNGETQFHLEHGKLAAALNSPHAPFFISTPHGRVEALGTEFTVKVE